MTNWSGRDDTPSIVREDEDAISREKGRAFGKRTRCELWIPMALLRKDARSEERRVHERRSVENPWVRGFAQIPGGATVEPGVFAPIDVSALATKILSMNSRRKSQSLQALV